MMKSFSELQTLTTFAERFEYLKTNSMIGVSTFGSSRYLNQQFYKSAKWLKAKQKAIIRDLGCDLGMIDYEIFSRIVVHHINPITVEDILNDDPKLYDLENLITVSDYTHKRLHYGELDKVDIRKGRSPNDQTPWATERKR